MDVSGRSIGGPPDLPRKQHGPTAVRPSQRLAHSSVLEVDEEDDFVPEEDGSHSGATPTRGRDGGDDDDDIVEEERSGFGTTAGNIQSELSFLHLFVRNIRVRRLFMTDL